MPSKKDKKTWGTDPEARPGHQDVGGKQHVVEGTTITLFAKFGVGSGSVEAHWLITDESKSKKPTKVEAKLPSRKEVVLDDVPDDKEKYSYKYRIAVNGTKQPGFAEYTVWPKHLDLKFEYDKQSGDTSTYSTGDPVEGMEFRMVQNGEQSRVWTSEGGGECAVDVVAGAAAEVLPNSPWYITDPTDQTKLPRKRTYKVAKKSWTAKIRSHDGVGTADTETDALRQYVNLAQDFPTHSGPLIKLVLGPEDLTKAKQDDEIFVKVTFPGANSERTTPLPAVWVTSDESSAVQPTSGPQSPNGSTDRVFERTLLIPNDGEAVELYVQVGYAGGDKCKVEVGTTESYGDQTLYVSNWRKLEVDMFHGNPAAGASQVSTHSVLRADDTAGFTDAQRTKLEDEFKRLFIEFSENRKLFYNPSDLGNADTQRALIVDGTYMGTTGKVVIANDDVLDHMAATLRTPSGNDVWVCFWYDYLSDWANLSKTTGRLYTGHDEQAFNVGPDEGLFKWNPNSTELSCTKISWRASQYYESGAWQPIGDASANPTFESARVGLGDWHEINDPDETTVDDFIEFVNWHRFKIKAPTAYLSHAGVDLKIRIEATFDTAEFTCNGCAVGGDLWMNTFVGRFHDNGLVATVLHEMGHNMGMAYGLKAMSTAKLKDMFEKLKSKRPPPKRELFDVGGRTSQHKIPGMPFPEMVPTGYYYLGHDHVGGHCARGLGDSDRKKLSYDGLTGGCIMFGESDMEDTTAMAFCEDCTKYIKATDVRDITKDW